MDGTPSKSLLRRVFFGPASAVVAAVIGGVFSLVSALLPTILPSAKDSPAKVETTANQVTPTSVVTKPRLTYGTWTLEESKDDSGTDWSNSVLKFTEQRPTEDGLELEGIFEWRIGSTLVGKEFVKGNYVEATRNIHIEGQAVESETDELAVGSFSARLAEDDRHLLDGTWGSTVGNRAGVPGTWCARR